MREILKNKLFYAGITREEYRRTLPTITESNRKNMRAFTMVTIIGMLIMIGASFFEVSLVKNRSSYLGIVLASAVMRFLLGKPAQKHPNLTYVCIYVFVEMLFAFGIVMGTFLEPRELAVSFPVLMFAVPQLFTDRPIRMNLAILVSLAAYFICAKLTQYPQTFVYNASNVIPYSIVSMIVSSYMMGMKAKRYLLQDENSRLVNTDQLTGILNRRCCDQRINELGAKGVPAGMSFCIADINGLKRVNDRIGHFAGDELVCAAAKCMNKVFGPYGACYRMDGDEFVAILEPGAPEGEELLALLQQCCADYRGEHIAGFSVSAGIVTAQGNEPLQDLIKEADRCMYAAKEAYYTKAENNRRC
ncbi:MAG: GGDEF domain-containing protein [Oscillospiraceae bacterium]|nr:GGDEF domain-containing protein [Oscillospiraceae bacterium]